MATEILMPRLSDSMEEGTVLRWIKAVGDDVGLGEELVEIETDKANMVFESDAAGTLIEIVAAEGETLPIGAVIARVGEAAEASSGNGGAAAAKADVAPQAAKAAPVETETPADPGSAAEPESAAPTPPAPASAGRDGRVKASPIARRIAREKGVELAGVQGSGPGGRILKSDVEAELARPRPAAVGPTAAAGLPAGRPAPAGPAEPTAAKGEVQVVELTRLQQTVSRRMAESKATAPHFYLQAEIEMTAAWDARARLKAAAPEGATIPSFNDMVVKACALALREFPRANGAYRDGRWELYSRVNVGVAVAANEALVVPTIFDADLKGLAQIATESRALAARVRSGEITPPELSGGTFTVSNLGMFGISTFQAVINAPQAAILAVGAITERPALRDGELTAARLMQVNLACDHRILYGADGAEFLGRVRTLLEEPLGLAL